MADNAYFSHLTEALNRIKAKGMIYEGIPTFSAYLMDRCLDPNPNTRMTQKEAIEYLSMPVEQMDLTPADPDLLSSITERVLEGRKHGWGIEKYKN